MIPIAIVQNRKEAEIALKVRQTFKSSQQIFILPAGNKDDGVSELLRGYDRWHVGSAGPIKSIPGKHWLIVTE